MKKNFFALALISVLMPSLSFGQKTNLDDFNLKYFGWINVDYKYSTDQIRHNNEPGNGNDQFGVGQSAFGLSGNQDKIHGVLVIGGSAMSLDSAEAGNFALRDAFLIYDDVKENNFKLSFGAQPLLFGLKPNGYPGDRSLRPSLEYGAMSSFNVAQQGEKAVRLDYVTSYGNIDLSLFDTAEGKNDATKKGSSIIDNYSLQFRPKNLFATGLFGNLGLQKRYLAEKNEGRDIISLGLGYEAKYFSLTVENLLLESGYIPALNKKETINVVEFELRNFSEVFWTYYDWSHAKEQNKNTHRLGLVYEYASNTTFQAELSQDKGGNQDSEGFDMRVQFKF